MGTSDEATAGGSARCSSSFRLTKTDESTKEKFLLVDNLRRKLQQKIFFFGEVQLIIYTTKRLGFPNMRNALLFSNDQDRMFSYLKNKTPTLLFFFCFYFIFNKDT